MAAGAADHHDRTMPSCVTVQRLWTFLTMNWFKGACSRGEAARKKGPADEPRAPSSGRNAAPQSPHGSAETTLRSSFSDPIAARWVERCAQEHTAADS